MSPLTKSHPALPLVLLILDGWGDGSKVKGNPLQVGADPVFEKLWKAWPHTMLSASGAAVGLPPSEPGNSEAGHTTIGAGRVVESDSVRVTKSIADGTFYRNPAFAAAIHHVVKHRSRMHIMGILPKEHSTHSDPQHLYALVDLIQREKVPRTFLHIFTDGRDSPPHSGKELLPDLESHLSNNETVATIAGRYYLNRKKQWDVTKKIYNVLVTGEGALIAERSATAAAEAYKRDETDQFIQPTIIAHTPTEIRESRIRNGDSVVFFNLRSDRARQLTKPFAQKDFESKNPGAFERDVVLSDLTFVAMTDFGPDLDHILTAYPSTDVKDTLPMALKSLRQLYIAETEKYAHLTYFFNGGYADTVAGEHRVHVPSPDVKHYDDRPAMSTDEITRTVLKYMREHTFDVYVINYACPDMIAHTGNYKAAVKAVASADAGIGKIASVIEKQHGTCVVTADHGNIEDMVNENGSDVDTQHSRNLVPFILVGNGYQSKKLRSGGSLADVAPTILKLLDIPQPSDMTGRPLW